MAKEQKKIDGVPTTDARKEFHIFLQKEVSTKLHNRAEVLKQIALCKTDNGVHKIPEYKNIKRDVKSQIETRLANIIKDEINELQNLEDFKNYHCSKSSENLIREAASKVLEPIECKELDEYMQS